MNPRSLKFFNIAKEVSKLSSITRHSIGAVLVSKNWNILGVGANVKKSHPKQAEFARLVGLEHKIFLHAELQCLVNAKHRNLHGSRIFVYREFRDGSLALARPCKICMAALKDVGIRQIYYTTADGYAHEILEINR